MSVRPSRDVSVLGFIIGLLLVLFMTPFFFPHHQSSSVRVEPSAHMVRYELDRDAEMTIEKGDRVRIDFLGDDLVLCIMSLTTSISTSERCVVLHKTVEFGAER